MNRMDSNRLPKQLLYGRLITGKRCVGRPKFRYQDSLKRSLVASEIDLCNWEALTANRSRWRKTVHSGVRLFHERAIRHREHKRAIRKGLLGAIGPGDFTLWHCDECGRACRGRIGLVSHQRAHSERPSKRRRICLPK